MPAWSAQAAGSVMGSFDVEGRPGWEPRAPMGSLRVNAGRRRQGLSLGQGSVYSFKQLLKAFHGLLTDFW